MHKVQIRTYLIFIVFLLGLVKISAVNGQDSNYTQSAYPKIMIIPFHPGSFQNDVPFVDLEDPYSQFQKSYLNASGLFRQNIDHALFQKLLIYFDITRLLFYENEQAKKDLELIYSSVKTEVRQERLKAIYKNFPNFTIFQILSADDKKYGVNCIDKESIKPVIKNPKLYYSDVYIINDELIPYLNSRYHCDYYLFINQFELKSRFTVCNNIEYNIQQRDLVLHFSLLDNYGKKVTGGLVGITYEPYTVNDIYELIEENIGIMSEMVVNIISQELGLTLRIDPVW
jgi:hypothetical protein